MGYVYGTGFGWFVWGASFVGWFCKWVVARYGGGQDIPKGSTVFSGFDLRRSLSEIVLDQRFVRARGYRRRLCDVNRG